MKPSIGRAVHYVQKMPEGCRDGLIHLPAIIVAIWGDTCVNLQVFTDGVNSEGGDSNNPPGLKHVTSVSQDETAQSPRSWHWPEMV